MLGILIGMICVLLIAVFMTFWNFFLFKRIEKMIDEIFLVTKKVEDWK
jgi:hypothetical protein